MRRIQLTLLALASFLLISGTAYAAAPEAPAQAQAQEVVAAAPAETAEAALKAEPAEPALCQLLETTRTNVLESATAGYYCPPYSRYCRTNAQCSGYCGPGLDHWAICQAPGCCSCLG